MIGNYPFLFWEGAIAPQIISGTAFMNDGVTPITSQFIHFVLNGVDLGATAQTDSMTGKFDITFASGTISFADDLLLYIGTGSNFGNLVIQATGSGGIPNANIYAQIVTAMNQTGRAMGNAQLLRALGSPPIAAAPFILYSVSGSDLTCTPSYDGSHNASFQTTLGTSYTLDGNITTTNTPVLFQGSATLASNSTLTAGSGNITMQAVGEADPVGNPSNLSVNTTGVVNIGAGATSLFVNQFNVLQSSSTLVQGPAAAKVISLSNTSGNIEFDGTVTVNNQGSGGSTSFTAAGSTTSVLFYGAGNLIVPVPTFNNTVSLGLGNSSSSGITFANGVTYSAGTTSTYGSVAVSSGVLDLATVVLQGNTAVSLTNTTQSGGNPMLGDVSGAHMLTINADPTTHVTIGDVNIGTLTLSTSGSTTVNTTTVINTLNTSGTASTQGPITFVGNVTVSTALSSTGSGYPIIFESGSTITPAVIFGNVGGGITFGSGTSSNITFTGGVNTVASGNTTIAGAATINSSGNITFGNVVGTGTAITNAGASGIITIASFPTPGGLNWSIPDCASATVTGSAMIHTLTTAIQPYDISFLGGGTVATNTTFLNTGIIEFGSSSASVMNFPLGVNTTSGSSTSLSGTLDTTNTTLTVGPLNLFANGTLNAGTSTVTMSSTVNSNVSGASFTVIGNTILPGGNITTKAGAVTLTGATSLNTVNVAIDTTGGGSALVGNSITTGSMAGTHDFSVNAGLSGYATIASINLPAHQFTITQSRSTTVAGALTVGTLNVQNTGISDTFNGLVTVTGSVVTVANPYKLIFNAGGTITPATTFINTAGIAFTSPSVPMTFTHGATYTADITTLNGVVQTTNPGSGLEFDTISLIGNSSLLTSVANGAITLDNIVRGTYDFTLSAGSGIITLKGVVGGVVPLSTLTMTSSNKIEVYNNITTADADVIFNGPALLHSLTITTGGGDLTFNGVINAQNTSTALVFTAGTGDITFVGAIGSANPYSLIASGANIFTSNNITTTGGPLTLLGDLILGANVVLNSNNGQITVGDVTGNSFMFSTNSGSGLTTINSILGASNFTIQNSGGVTIAGVVTVPIILIQNSSGIIAFNGPLTCVTDFITGADTYSLVFGNTTSLGTTSPGGLDLLNLGGVTFGSSLSPTITILGGAALTYNSGPTILSGYIVTTAGAVTLGGGGNPITLAANSSIVTNGAAINLSSAVNGDFALILNAGNFPITLSLPIGNLVPLSSLDVFANPIYVSANITTQGNTQTYHGPVVLLADVAFLDTAPNGGITFDAGISGNYNLSVSAGGPVVVIGAIDTSGSSGSAGGNVSIASTNSSITVGTMTTSGGNGATGGNAGAISLQPSLGYSSQNGVFMPNGIIQLGGPITALGGTGAPNGSNGTIGLSAAGRSQIMGIATISSTSSDVTINGGSLNIGPNECLTVFGNITLNLSNEVSFADMIALKAITVTAPNITCQLHGSGNILNSQGKAYKTLETHLFAVDPIQLIGDVSFVGSGFAAEILQLTTLTESQLLFGSAALNYDNSNPNSSEVIESNLVNSELLFRLAYCSPLDNLLLSSLCEEPDAEISMRFKLMFAKVSHILNDWKPTLQNGWGEEFSPVTASEEDEEE